MEQSKTVNGNATTKFQQIVVKNTYKSTETGSKSSLNASRNGIHYVINENHPATSNTIPKRQQGKTAVGHKNSLQPNQNSLLNSTLIALINQKSGKSNVKIGSKGGGQASLATKKVLKVTNRAKSACREKAELFNYTAPIKFFSNLEERESATKEGTRESNVSTANQKQSKPRVAGGSSITKEKVPEDKKVTGGTQQLNFSKRKTSLLAGQDGSQPRKSQHKANQKTATSSLIEFSKVTGLNQNPIVKPPGGAQITIEGGQKMSNSFATQGHRNSGDYTIPHGQTNPKIHKHQLKMAYSTQMNATQTQQNLQQNQKIKLRLNSQKTRSSSSLSNGQQNIVVQPSQISELHQAKAYQSVKAQFGVTVKSRTGTFVDGKKTAAKSGAKDQVSKSFQGSGTLKKKQTMRGLMEAHNVIKGTSTRNENQSKRKSSLSPYSSNQQTKAQFKSGPEALTNNYGTTQSFSKNKDPKTYNQFNYNSLTATQVTGAVTTEKNSNTTGASGSKSKSSSSFKHLPHKKKLNNSLLLFNSTAKQQLLGNAPMFARVDFDRINSGNTKKQQTDSGLKNTIKNQTESYQNVNASSSRRIFNRSNNSKGAHNSTQKALDNSITRLNLPKPNSRKSIEDSSSYFGTCTASGPLNPFLEQILKEIPNATTVNSTNVNTATCTSTVKIGQIRNEINPIGLNFQPHGNEKDLQPQSTGKSKSQDKISKKIRSNIANMGPQINRKDDRQMSNKFNLTTTATALLAASDKNAAEMVNTFESNPSIRDTISKHNQNSAGVNSTKKKSMNKVVASATTLEAREKRREQSSSINNSKLGINESKAPSRLSHKSGGKKQSSVSSKRYRVNVTKNQSNQYEDTTKGTFDVDNSTSNITQSAMSSKLGSLMNVVKVAAKQKEIKLNSSLINQKVNLGKKTHFSLNTTQVLEEQLQSFKLQNKNSFNIPQKLKSQVTKVQKQQTAQSSQPAAQPTVTKQPATIQPKQATGVTIQKTSITTQPNQHQQHSQSRLKNRKSNQVQFDWSGFLTNLLHENLKPKKSTSGPGNVGSALYSQKPYQLEKDMQNKTQPLPKGLIQKDPNNNAYTQDNKLEPYGAVNYAATHLQRVESRGSECRPRIGRKQIDIAPPSGAQTHFAATLNNQQLKATVAAAQAVTVLTEATDSAAEESKNKESSGSAPSTHRSPDKVNEDYKFGRLLGEGAYAVVRLAYKKSEGKNYAAKIYDKSKLIDEHRRSSVCREVMLMQKLKHQYIVEFHEAFETDHHVYLVMEHVQGRSLHDYLKKQRAIPGKTEFDQTLEEEEVKRIMRQILQCLEYLHGIGITHRDIKLENILLDNQTNVKLIDFGFSTCYQPQKKLKMFCGTPSYMAPEIVSRIEYYGPPADIWACGVLLFSLLNGFFPFKGQTDAELYRRIQRGMFKLIRSDLSDDCLNLLKEMLNVNQDARMTANELLQENWFMTDSSKKRSHAEMRRQFKERILKKFPIKSVNKNTICLPATQPNNPIIQNMQNIAETDAPEESKESKVVTQDSLSMHRNVHQASPPSCMSSSLPNSSQSNQNALSPPQSQGQGNAMTNNEGGDQINQEALLAYYNTSGGQMHPTVSGIAPPSGKFTPYVAYQGNIQGQQNNGVPLDAVNTDLPAYEQAIPPSHQRWPPVQVKRDNFMQIVDQGPNEREAENAGVRIIDASDIEIVIQGTHVNTVNHLGNKAENDLVKNEYRDACNEYKDHPIEDGGKDLDTSGLSYGATLPANKQ